MAIPVNLPDCLNTRNFGRNNRKTIVQMSYRIEFLIDIGR